MKKNKTAAKGTAEDRALDKFAEMMISKISSIQGDWKKPWFTEGALAWPRNLSGREYNGMNAMMLMMRAETEGYQLPLWCTFDRLARMNGSKGADGKWQKAVDASGNPLPHVGVNKGEKSFPVFVTTFRYVNMKTNEKISYNDYQQMDTSARKDVYSYPRLQVYSVFNVSQTNMKEARPELYGQLVEKYGGKPKAEQTAQGMFEFDAVDHIVEAGKWICPIRPTYGDDAYYSISTKEIVVPEKKQFRDGESFYSNLFHEMAHSTGAEDQLGRLKPSSFGSKEYAREELVAEMTAALTAQRYGIEKCIKEDSCAYLKNWLESLREDASFIKTVLIDVRKAASMLCQCIDGVQAEMVDNKEK